MCRVVPAHFGIPVGDSSKRTFGWMTVRCTARGVSALGRAKDRSDVLFDLSAADGRRLYSPESARDQSDAYLMLMASFNKSKLAASAYAPCVRLLGELRD
jgi:hypothetical protein